MPISTVTLPTVPLRVYRAGKGIPLLLVHGFPLDHTMWRHQLAKLASGFEVIAPDLRGFGGSDVVDEITTMATFADDLASLLAELKVNQPVVYCGLSMGGYIGWEFFRRHRSLLRGMILCDTRAAADAPSLARGRRQSADKVIKEGVRSIAGDMLERIFCDETRRSQGHLVTQTRETILKTDRRGVAAALRGMAERSNFTSELADVDVPCLVICGAEDAITPPAEMRQLAEQIPNAVYEETPAAGHMSPLENPAAVNAAIQKFLSGLNG